MKRLIVIVGLMILSFSIAVSAEAEQLQDSNNYSNNNQVYIPCWWESISQTWSYDQSYFNGKGQNGSYQGLAMGFHIRPAWQWKRFKGRFDFAIYKNPWYRDEWQWGTPMPSVKPRLPNFVDSFTYHGERVELNYQEINDLNFGHGLIINEYHPVEPFHGWKVGFNPTATTKVILVATREIIYFEPFRSNDLASFQAFRIDQSFQTGDLKWQIGLTGVHDGYKLLDPKKYPAEGSEYDISLTNIIWLSPFLESGGYQGFGRADMLGVKGKLGLISYQAGQFKTDGLFLPNFYGGRYEELKWNSGAVNAEPALPDLSRGAKESREGYIGRLWVEVNPWLEVGHLYIDDLEDTIGLNFTAKIERLPLESGLFYYRMFRNADNYDWFIKGRFGFFGYEYHYYLDWNHKYRNEFEVSYRF